METEYRAAQVSRRHERAATWFAEQGETDEAVHHALAAANPELAARVIGQGLCAALNRDDPLTLQRWLRLLPEAMIQRRPDLLLLKAWVVQFSWQLGAQTRIMDEVEALLAADEGRGRGELEYDPGIVRGQVALLRGQWAFWANRPDQAITLCQESLALLPQAWTYARGAALVYKAVAMWTRGDGDAIWRFLTEGYESLENKTDYVALRYLLAICLTRYQAGQLEHLQQTALVLQEQAHRSSLAYMSKWAQYFLGVVHYERSELENAGAPLSYLVEHQRTIFMAMLHDAFALMALVSQAQGAPERAMQLSRQLSESDIERLGDENDVSRSLRARLQFLEDDLEKAGRWADTFTQPLPDRPLLWIEKPHLTRARILIARNRDDDTTIALEVLDAMLDLARRTHSTPAMIEALTLRALALDAMSRQDEALNALRQALDLCSPGDFTRVFVELGPHMRAMLRRLALDGYATETIRRILTVFFALKSRRSG